MKKRKIPNVIILLILSFVTIICGVFFNIFRAFMQKPNPVVPQEIILKLDPTLDTNTLDQMKQKLYPSI
jgi:flagellar basal body-associated protein FliL